MALANFCTHSLDDYYCINLSAQTTRIIPETCRNLLNTYVKPLVKFGYETLFQKRFNSHLYDFTHKCMVVTFQCDKCGRELKRTYEHAGKWHGETLPNGARKRNGCPRYIYMACNIPLTRVSYAMVERCFDNMPSKVYNALWYNCGHWTKRFYARIIREKLIMAPPFWFNERGYLGFDFKWIERRTEHNYECTVPYFSEHGEYCETYTQMQEVCIGGYIHMIRRICRIFNHRMEDNDQGTLRFIIYDKIPLEFNFKEESENEAFDVKIAAVYERDGHVKFLDVIYHETKIGRVNMPSLMFHDQDFTKEEEDDEVMDDDADEIGSDHSDRLNDIDQMSDSDYSDVCENMDDHIEDNWVAKVEQIWKEHVLPTFGVSQESATNVQEVDDENEADEPPNKRRKLE